MTKNNNKDIALYKSEDGQLSFSVNVFDDTVWLSQQQMAELFDKDRKTITWHISNIFKEGELKEKVVCWENQHTTQHGAIKGRQQNVKVKYYNLDLIISVGYRVKSKRGIQFRQWATKILKQYLINGYAINEKRIKDIEEKIDNLSIKLEDKLQKELQEINKTLLEIVKKPIIIQNQINNNLSIGILEQKIIDLIDEIISNLKSQNSINAFEKAKNDLEKLSKDKKAKNRLLKFIEELGDENSDISKSLKGFKKVKVAVKELIKLFNKLV